MTIRPIEPGESRIIRCAPESRLTREERGFIEVTLQKFGPEPTLLLVFGGVAQELAGTVARDFADRVARAMKTRITPGSLREMRCGRTLTRDQRHAVAVFLQDDFDRTWLRLEFAEGQTVDFPVKIGRDFGRRIARASKAMIRDEPIAA